MRVVVIFCMTILFGIIAPSGDVLWDFRLLFDTITFNLGASYELAGCRACYGLSEDEVYLPKKGSCQICLQHPRKRETTSEYNPLTYCGQNSNYVDKLIQLEKELGCTNKTWVFANDTDSFGREDTCDSNDDCCMPVSYTHLRAHET